MPVVNRIAEFAADMTAWRRHLHGIPELGLDCPETAAFVAKRLRAFGVDEVHGGIAKTGLVAIIEGQGPGPTIGLRADMDGLPIAEATEAHARVGERVVVTTDGVIVSDRALVVDTNDGVPLVAVPAEVAPLVALANDTGVTLLRTP